MSPEERIAIARDVYETLLANTQTFHGTCGADGLYLIGAILQGGDDAGIQVAKNASICVALRGAEGTPGLPPNHPVWTYIEEGGDE